MPAFLHQLHHRKVGQGFIIYGKVRATGNSTGAFAVPLETTSTLLTTVAPSVSTTPASRPATTTTRLPALKTTKTTVKSAAPKNNSLCSATRECGNWVRMPAPGTQSQPLGGHPAFRNKHIVMIGDSRMRYQYMSLAYFFTSGAFATGEDLSLLTSAEKSGKNWASWFNRTNHLLKYELCNCRWAQQNRINIASTLQLPTVTAASQSFATAVLATLVLRRLPLLQLPPM